MFRTIRKAGISLALLCLAAPPLSIPAFAGHEPANQALNTIRRFAYPKMSAEKWKRCEPVLRRWFQFKAHVVRPLTAQTRRQGTTLFRSSRKCLDRHSGLLLPTQWRSRVTSMRGGFVGVGLRVGQKRSGEVFINSVFPESPLRGKGIQKGDVIVKVRQDGEAHFTIIRDLKHAVSLLRGKRNTKVHVILRRPNGQTYTVSVVRKAINLPTVFAKKLDGGIGYVRITMFSNRTADEFEAAVKKLKVTHLVVDLRNNPGGSLGGVMEMLYYFSTNLDDVMLSHDRRGPRIVKTIRDPSGISCYRGRGRYVGIGAQKRCGTFVFPGTQQIKAPGVFAHYKVTVLINGRSASASEVFAGTMQDWGRKKGNFIVVGEKSYGKGIVQTMYRLRNRFGLALTTSEYLVGNSAKKIHRIGVVPNVSVVNSARIDSQLIVALGYLKRAAAASRSH